MALIINIDQALKNPSEYNVLREPMNDMLMNIQEAWEKKNPVDFFFARGSINTFQETYSSSIGFEHAFSETSDYGIGPIFNTEEGFSATYRSRTFQGGFTITQQTLEDRLLGKAKGDATAFIKRWHADIVEYCITAIQGGFGQVVNWGSDKDGGVITRLKLDSADTTDGDVLTATKNPLFTNAHTIVKRAKMTAAEITANLQSNAFYADLDLTGSDPAKIAKLADIINQVVTTMENYKDDNNKRAGVLGTKRIVCANDPHLKAALNTALSLEMFGEQGLNPGYKRCAGVDDTPYLLDIAATKQITKVTGSKVGQGFFIVDSAYNAENHGLELTERVPFTLNVKKADEAPYGIKYQGRQRWDVNCASWRGITYVYLGNILTDNPTWCDKTKFTKVVSNATIVKPVSIDGTVTTSSAT